MKDLFTQHAEKFRYALVGGFNTALDFGILFDLSSLGINKLGANFISTSIAFVFSFFANRTFTFKANGNAKHEFVAFLIVTLFGLWVLQPLTITAVDYLLAHSSLSSASLLFVAKLAATLVSLIWNYILYSRVVFKKR